MRASAKRGDCARADSSFIADGMGAAEGGSFESRRSGNAQSLESDRAGLTRTVLIVQNHVEQRAVDLQSTFGAASVVDKTQLSETVHEEADARTGGADHFCQRLLAHLRHC